MKLNEIDISNLTLIEAEDFSIDEVEGTQRKYVSDCGQFTFDVQIESTEFVEKLFGIEPTYDVVTRDAYGNEVRLAEQEIEARPIISLRHIPRKMKKQLKKHFGKDWLQHHPNVENFAIVVKYTTK